MLQEHQSWHIGMPDCTNPAGRQLMQVLGLRQATKLRYTAKEVVTLDGALVVLEQGELSMCKVG